MPTHAASNWLGLPPQICNPSPHTFWAQGSLRYALRDALHGCLPPQVFGVLEHFDASLCLIRYSFGSWAASNCASRCAATSAHPPSASTSTAGTPAAAVVGERASYGSSNASLEELRQAVDALRVHEVLYAQALGLFLRRVAVVEERTGATLECEDSSTVPVD